jgi:hypothetical protein
MPKYMIIHHKDPKFVSYHINSACKICAREKRANWKRVFYNLKKGRIFCEWEASDQATLEDILNECQLPCEQIIEVEEMTPDECSWKIFGELEE